MENKILNLAFGDNNTFNWCGYEWEGVMEGGRIINPNLPWYWMDKKQIYVNKNNIKSPRKHRKTKVHHRRNRRGKAGELLQIDATPHEFFAGDNNKYTLHGLIDDASGQITGLYMCKNECMQGYFEIMRQTLRNFDVPESIYADGSSIFFTTKKDKLTIEDVLDFKKYTIVDNHRPKLCADRIDGIILTSLGWTKKLSMEEVPNIIIYNEGFYFKVW